MRRGADLTPDDRPGIAPHRLRRLPESAQERAAHALAVQKSRFIGNRIHRQAPLSNVYGTILVSQAFAPILARNGGGAIINVLSDATWLARPVLAAYSTSKAAVWSFTNSLRVELRAQATQVLGLHVGFMDTDMTAGLDMAKTSPAHVASAGLAGIEDKLEEVLADESTRVVKRSLSGPAPLYLNPPEIA